jgi:hypothetical protein
MVVCCGKKRRLRRLGDTPGHFSLGAFAGNALAVNPGFHNQVERGRGKSKFMLRDRQTAAVSFHGI